MRASTVLMLMLILSLGLTIGCDCGDDDDDDDDNDASDDDAGDDDASDDDAADDDAADDDAADDDSADDDTGDDDAADDDATDDASADDDTTELFDIDFEDYDLGNLPSPWTVEEGGNSYVEIVNDPTKRTGKVLNIAGGDQVGDYVYATYPVTHSSDLIAIEYDVHVPGNGSAYVQFKQTGDTDIIGRLNMVGGTQTIQFDYMNNWANCGSFSGNTWYNVRIEFDFSAMTADVYLDNALTQCENTPLNPNATFDHLGQIVFTDYSGAGEGGVPKFDNFYGYEWN